MNANELDNRFAYHAPPDEARREAHGRVRGLCRALAGDLDALLPESREKFAAVERLEEVMFWANAAIARQEVSDGEDLAGQESPDGGGTTP